MLQFKSVTNQVSFGIASINYLKVKIVPERGRSDGCNTENKILAFRAYEGIHSNLRIGDFSAEKLKSLHFTFHF
jgi:hypothetical protein